MTINPAFLLRQLWRSPKQAVVFVLCVMLAIVTLAAVTGFADNLRQTLMRDARRLHAADIIIRSHEPLSPGLKMALENARAGGRIRLSTYYRFYSVVRTADDRNSLLANLKVVDREYPFYGIVGLRSGKPFHDVLGPGRVVAAQSLLDRLGLHVGDKLKVGYTTLTLADVVISEPDRPVDVFSLGPRLFVSIGDLDALGLIKTGSRIHYVHLVKVMNPAERDSLARQFSQAAQADRERVDTFETARSGIKRFLDNFLLYLRLIGVFILIIAGVGIQSSLTAFLREKEASIAIMKTVGADNRYIARHFATIVAFLGLAGIALGIVAGYLVQGILSQLLASFLPPDTSLAFSWRGALEGFVLGATVVAIFSFIPLYRLGGMRPLAIFRRENPLRPRRGPHIIIGGAMVLFTLLLTMRQLQSLRMGLYVTFGIGALVLAASLMTRLLLAGLKRLHLKGLILRQSVRGLFRNGNATRSVVITLTASLTVILSIFLIEKNLKAVFVDSFPADAPNLFFIDIQPS
ncbi:MAG: FtsX-like permease family protein, partial [Desulfosarcinaceae bacterium]